MLKCEWTAGCDKQATAIAQRGWIYCASHAARSAAETRPMLPAEIAELEDGGTISWTVAR